MEGNKVTDQSDEICEEYLIAQHNSLSDEQFEVDDYSSGTPVKVVVCTSYDKHDTQGLRTAHNFNLLVLLYCFFYDVCFLFFYPGAT